VIGLAVLGIVLAIYTASVMRNEPGITPERA